MFKRFIAVLAMLGSVGLLGFAELPNAAWEFVEQAGTLWLQRRGEVPLAGDGELCPDLPRIDYLRTRVFDEIAQEELESTVLGKLFWRGRWFVRPLHIWGVYSEIGCKEPLGWGTAFLVGLYKRTYIWLTVEHNVATSKYFQSIFGRVIATNWFIQDDEGNFKELWPVGCKDGKFCVLISSYVHGTSSLSLDDDIISNDISLLMETYVYGCSVQAETVRRYKHYRIHHFCFGNAGYVNSPDSVPVKVGGDFLISNPAMPGFSGAPVLTYQDGQFLVLGTVNAGVQGVFTAINAVNRNTIRAVKEWLQYGENLFNQPER